MFNYTNTSSVVFQLKLVYIEQKVSTLIQNCGVRPTLMLGSIQKKKMNKASIPFILAPFAKSIARMKQSV